MSKLLKIRNAKPADLASMAALETEAFPDSAFPPFFFRQAYDVFPDLLLFAEGDDGGLVGYTLGGLQAGMRDAWLMTIVVRKPYRGKGIGRKLIEEVSARLKKLGAESLSLTVKPDNANAIAMYSRLGFKKSHEDPDYFGPGDARIIMVRKV